VTEHEIGVIEVPCGSQRGLDKEMHTNVDAGVESMCSANVQATESLLAIIGSRIKISNTILPLNRIAALSYALQK
jgi:hypothetical protein